MSVQFTHQRGEQILAGDSDFRLTQKPTELQPRVGLDSNGARPAAGACAPARRRPHRALLLALVVAALAPALALATPALSQAAALQICFVSHSGACVGSAGWQQPDGAGDACGAATMYSYAYGYDVSVWVDDSLGASRQAVVNCEAFSLGRPAFHIFVGKAQGEGSIHFAYAENLQEWYPFHWAAGCAASGCWGSPSPAGALGGCPYAAGNDGFVTQWNFAWDSPPNSYEQWDEWWYAYSCVPAAGPALPMGHY